MKRLLIVIFLLAFISPSNSALAEQPSVLVMLEKISVKGKAPRISFRKHLLKENLKLQALP
jgi:hypothetical protein